MNYVCRMDIAKIRYATYVETMALVSLCSMRTENITYHL